MVFFVCKTPFRCAMMYKMRKKNVRNTFRAGGNAVGGSRKRGYVGQSSE